MRTRLPLSAALPFLVLLACTHARPAEDATRGAGQEDGTSRAIAWRKACAQGDASACQKITASVLYSDRGDLLMAGLTDLEAGCAKGVQDACAAVQIARLQPDKMEESVQALSRSCAGGSYFACFLELPLSLELAGSEEAKVAIVQQAATDCESQGGVKCSTAAGLYEHGIGVVRDGSRADALYARGCESKDPASCYQQGIRLAESPDAEQLAAARKAYALACDASVGPACFNLAYQLFEGKGGSVDPNAGRAQATRACDLGDRTACDFLARTNEGKTFPPPEGSAAFTSPEEFERVHRKYCDLGGGEACSALAFLKGDVIEKSGKLEQMEPILGLLQQGCDAGSVRSCNSLGHVVRDAIAACESGVSNQCTVAGFAHARGIRLPRMAGESLPPEPTKAREAFQKACDGGQTSVCDRAKAAATP